GVLTALLAGSLLVAGRAAAAHLRVRGNQLVDGPGRGHPGVTAVRSTGARQPLALGGLQYSSELGGWTAHLPRVPRHQEIAAQHNYGGLSPCDAGCRARVLAAAGRHPALFSELGETDCAHGYVDQMLGFADRHRLGYLGWAWDATSAGGWNCSSRPALITACHGSPTPYGIGLRDHLRGLGPASPALP
ncbi:MAG: hypothetical protein M3Y09_14090, partial [Actinomycetota bacterium]|nr:hypothetical protein [Actinomycetota bacterium]